MSIQDMEDLKQQYLDEMRTLINGKDYRDGNIDIEIKINELKGNFNEISIEIRKKEKEQQEQVANLSTYPSRHFKSFCYDDDMNEEFNLIHNEDPDSTPKDVRFDAESYLLESSVNHDTLMNSSPKIDSILDEFAGELKTIPPGIVNTDHEEYISLMEC
ncbi:hypothetical protein Tco_0146314 [Tanacetum coccineum]